MGDIYECLESHRNDPATVNDLELALLNYDGGLVRNIATAGNERTSTSTGAQDGRAGGLGPTAFSSGSTSHSTVTAVAKPFDLLATPFIDDLMDEVTEFERLVTFWEREATDTVSELVNIGVVIKGLEK